MYTYKEKRSDINEKNSLKILLSAAVISTAFMTQNVLAASGSSQTYSTYGTSVTRTEFSGQTLTATANFYYESNLKDHEYVSTVTNSGTGPNTMSATARTKHNLCYAKRTVGNHRVDGWAEFYTYTSRNSY